MPTFNKWLLFILPILALSGCSNKNMDDSGKTVNPDNDHTLVAYFSVTNNTEKLAKYAQEYLNCDIFEIVPKEEYTSEDINYNTDCRAYREQNDDNARPEIKNEINDISKYDTIVLGYPIWWGQAPKILYTFVESYDLSNRTILPFCTSGSSPIGSSATNLVKSAPNANWLEGRRFSSGASKKEIGDWLGENLKKDEDMKLLIDEKEIAVNWESNDSVKELNKLKPLTVNMTKYGGFEQVGPIGKSITSHDVDMTTSPGDIVLYDSSNIVIFYGTNSWSYTKLGHIDLSKEELIELLDKSSVVLNIK